MPPFGVDLAAGEQAEADDYQQRISVLTTEAEAASAELNSVCARSKADAERLQVHQGPALAHITGQRCC